MFALCPSETQGPSLKQVQRTKQEKKRALTKAASCGENTYWDTYCLDKGHCASCAGDLMRESERGPALGYDSDRNGDDWSEEKGHFIHKSESMI